MIDIMNECWYQDPFARLPIARVRKRLMDIDIQNLSRQGSTSRLSAAGTESSLETEKIEIQVIN